jgi:hypothetical protein
MGKPLVALVVAGFLSATVSRSAAQSAAFAVEQQVAAALLPLPLALRAGAGVRGWDAEFLPVSLREGSNGMICTADRPGNEEFDVRCYHQDFLAVMDRWRDLVRGGLDAAAAEERLDREVREGALVMPERPTAGYRMLGPIEAYDPATRRWTKAIHRWQSVHFPYEAADEMGLPTEPEGTMPYVMESGMWWSHVMIDFAGGDSTEAATMRATGTFDVELAPPPGPDGTAASTGRMTIAKRLQGDLEGTSAGQMLTGMTGTEGSAGYVAIEEVRGTLHGRSGTFLLQHSGTMRRGAPQLSIAVVPDSGTGQLTGLAGEMTIEIADGVHSYVFEYTLPQAP